MPATAAATVSPFLVIPSGEDHDAVFKIKITGRKFGYGLLRGMISGEGVQTFATDTDLIPKGFRTMREKLRGNDHTVAPARAMVGPSGTKMTLDRTTAKQALQGLE